MKHTVVPTLILLSGSMLGPPVAAAWQVAAPAQGGTHAVIPVRLSTSIDTKKAKQGDEVVTKTEAPMRIGDGTLISSGTKILGHLTEVEAVSKGDPQSSLQMVFDRMQLAGGRELKIKGTLQALAPGAEVETGAAGSGTIASGLSSAGTMASPGSQADEINRNNKDSSARLNTQSRGVLGFHDLEMGVDSTLTSPAKQIKLNNGTQMMLKVELE